MSIPRYTATESQERISPSHCCSSQSERADLPLAVGPATTIRGLVSCESGAESGCRSIGRLRIGLPLAPPARKEGTPCPGTHEAESQHQQGKQDQSAKDAAALQAFASLEVVGALSFGFS